MDMTLIKLGRCQPMHYRSAGLTDGELLLAVFSWNLCKFFPICDSVIVFEDEEIKVFNRISTSCRALELQFNSVYILECCQKLEEAGEYRSDTLLVQLVRLQEIRYRMSRSFPYDVSLASQRSSAPVEMLVRAWQKELEEFWASLPFESHQNCIPSYTNH